MSDIFVYAIAAELAKADPAASLGKALRKKPRAKKPPSVIDRIRDHDAQLAAVIVTR